MRFNDLPASTTSRSLAAAAAAMVSRRATLLAKLATATRPLTRPITSLNLGSRSASEPEVPGTSALVESQTMANTPSSPRRLSASSSAVGPITGAGSNFQSPVCSTVPAGVRMATALGSGIEWVTVMSSRSNGPTENFPPSATSMSGTSASRSTSRSLRRKMEAVNGVA